MAKIYKHTICCERMEIEQVDFATLQRCVNCGTAFSKEGVKLVKSKENKVVKRVQLIDLLNDLEKETEINKRIKEQLDSSYDKLQKMQHPQSSITSSVWMAQSTLAGFGQAQGLQGLFGNPFPPPHPFRRR